MWQPKRALLSVSDKTQVLQLAQFLVSKNVEIVSTGGTAKLLADNGIAFMPIENLTKRPEAFGGRMKSISFELASGLLYRRGHEGDEKQLSELGILPVDLIVCNLYPFTNNLNQNLSLEEMVELVDVGGPTMIRAAAKNFEHVACLTQVVDYDLFISEWEQQGGISLSLRKLLAQKSFFLLSQYDETIALELGRRFEINPIPQIPYETTELRYGENPQQKGWSSTFANFNFSQGSYDRKQIQGKDLSYNNFLDMDHAHKCVSDLAYYLPQKLNHVVIVKHGNPCGVASHKDVLVALQESFACDMTSAFGGIVAFSSPVDDKMAEWLSQHFFEVILAPSFSIEAISLLGKKKNLRLVSVPLKKANTNEITVRSILGMKLWQKEDESFVDFDQLRGVTTQSLNTLSDSLMRFGIICTKYLKSNAIGLFIEKNNTLSIAASGVGQPNRIDCLTRLAAPRAKEKGINLGECLMVSDAFFPFDDMITTAHEYGIKSIIQPGGSLRDDEVIETCNRLNVAMAFSGQRHFRH